MLHCYIRVTRYGKAVYYVNCYLSRYGRAVCYYVTHCNYCTSGFSKYDISVTLFPLLEKLYSLYIRLSLICQNKLSRNNKLYYKLCAIYILYSENRKKNIKKLYTVGLREIGGSLIHKMENISQIWIMDQ